MKSSRMAMMGIVVLSSVSVAGFARADAAMTTAAEVQQFQAAKMTLAEAIAAAEKSAGGLAMEASWESGAAGGYQVVVVKADASRVLAVIGADGMVQVQALPADQDEQADGGDGDGETQD